MEKFIEAGRLNPKETITMKHLYVSGIVGKIKFGVKLLGQGSKSFSTPINIEVSGASNSAIDAIEKCGGTITSVYYNRLGLRVLLKPEKFEGLGPLPRRARPPPKLMNYYTSDEKRGEFSVFVRNRDSNNNTVVGEGEREGEEIKCLLWVINFKETVQYGVYARYTLFLKNISIFLTFYFILK